MLALQGITMDATPQVAYLALKAMIHNLSQTRKTLYKEKYY
jgi:hypothetical protein